MPALAIRTSIAAAILALLPLPGVAAAEGTRSGSPEQQRIEDAYTVRLQAAQEKAQDQRIAAQAKALLSDSASPVLGNPKGDVTIVEFFDYTCPYCKAVEPRLQKLLKDDRNVKIVVKEFPILTPESLIAAKVALASQKQGKYLQYHQALMNFKGRLANDVIFDTAKSVGLDVDRVRKDMEAPEITDEIIANFNLARSLRIFQTPAFISGGHMLDSTSANIDFTRVAASVRGK
ncbi:MAG TPA: DsbA family protein [Micropepsaceae bacterium]|jgi:protein-disulfide isomerase